jgi:ribonuclease BN (tRNA processing enzyme)
MDLLAGVTLRRVGPRHLRLGTDRLWVDVLEHPGGNVRVGTFPDIVKWLAAFAIETPVVIVPPRRVTLDGDNWTGEEFVGWAAIFGSGGATTYAGTTEVLEAFRRRLELTMPWYFDDRHVALVRRDVMDRHFRWLPIDAHGMLPNGLALIVEGALLRLMDGAETVLDVPLDVTEPAAGDPGEPARKEPIDGLQVTCLGSGTGFGGRSASFVFGWGNRLLLLDPTARPRDAMADAGATWSGVTDLLVTHNHEDHILGLTAAVEGLRREGRRATLLTSRSVIDTLNRQAVGLWEDVRAFVDWVPLEPGTTIGHHGARIAARLNHHILPSDTLGLVVEHGGRRVGFSGDTKYDRTINATLRRPDLDADWFGDCDVVFHEVFFGTSIHTAVNEVEALAAAVPGEVYLYHCQGHGPSAVPSATDGATYRIEPRRAAIMGRPGGHR